VNSAPRPADLVVVARWIVPVEPAGTVLDRHAVVVTDGRIVAIEPAEGIASRWDAAERHDLEDHVLVPGLVNAHTHAAMSLMRGLADDLPLMRWLREHIWPVEMKHVSDRFVYDGTRAAAAEMLLGGITTANDMYFHPEAAARAFVDAGMRACVGMIAVEFPTPYASDAEDYLAKGLATRDRFRDEPLVGFCLAPHAPYTVADRTLERIVTIAEELDLPIHTHLHETTDEIAASLREHGTRPLERLARLGMVSPRLMAVHAVHLEPGEVDALAHHGASVVHCPSSNLKLASGFAPVAALRAAGVNVALGTDGAASNNRLDIWTEMRTAALLAKAVAGAADAFPAHEALEAATLAGARALGLDHLIGTLSVGKRADMIAVALAGPGVAPCYHPLSHLAYVCGRSEVARVWVDGQLKVADGTLVDGSLTAVEERVCLWQNILVS
jgi:5-methylthioadenosine/S-adenosylhomocysteine deaminase